MSGRRRLTIALSPTDRVASVAGHLGALNVDAAIVHADPGSIFQKMLGEQAYDVAEMSFGAYAVERSRGNRTIVAVPVFTSKMFRHTAIYVRADNSATVMADLQGRRVGLPGFLMTAAIWLRSIMQTQYGVDPRSMRWRTGGLNVAANEERVALRVPPGYEIEPITAGTTLEEGLLGGSLDALITSRVPRSFSDGSGRLRRLLAEPHAEELAYYRRTGVIPIMHLLVVRTELLREDPALRTNLVEAFTRAKDDALKNLVDLDYLSTSLLWLSHHHENERRIFGDDAFAYGVAPNIRAIEAFLEACAEQGLLHAPLTVADVIPPDLEPA